MSGALLLASRCLAGSALVTMVLAHPLRAAEGLFLTWSECALSGASSGTLTSPCASEVGEQSLYCAFTLPQALDSVIAVEIVLDLQVALGTLPAWWRFEPGGCRFGLLDASAFFTGMACKEFWHGQATSDGIAGYYVGEPRGGAGQARIKIAFALLSGLYRRLDADSMYYAARVVFPNDRTSACLGCSAPACLVLNSIKIGRLKRLPGEDPDFTVQAPGPNLANRATWQGGANCEAVPVRSGTWGAIKSLYR